jgi:hypothetical protein
MVNQKEELIKYLIEHSKADKKWRDIGRKFGFEGEQARQIWRNYRQKNKIEPVESLGDEVTVEDVINRYTPTWEKLKNSSKIINQSWDEETLLVLNLPDLHLDKLDLQHSTIEQNIDIYFEVFNNLLKRAYHSAKISKIVLVIGNDLFNTDNIHNSTANGTPQKCNTTWDKAFEKVFDAMVETIAICSNFCCDVHIVLVQGNHDKSKSYYLSHSLEQYFRSDNSITFDRSNTTNKAVTWGNSFIGFNHGNNVNDKLPLDFAQEFYQEWGQCKYHDIYIGDKHHNNEKVFRKKQMQDEKQGVRLRILPSLSKPDTWHDENLYKSRQSGIAILYDKKRGKSAEFEYQL